MAPSVTANTEVPPKIVEIIKEKEEKKKRLTRKKYASMQRDDYKGSHGASKGFGDVSELLERMKREKEEGKERPPTKKNSKFTAMKKDDFKSFKEAFEEEKAKGDKEGGGGTATSGPKGIEKKESSSMRKLASLTRGDSKKGKEAPSVEGNDVKEEAKKQRDNEEGNNESPLRIRKFASMKREDFRNASPPPENNGQEEGNALDSTAMDGSGLSSSPISISTSPHAREGGSGGTGMRRFVSMKRENYKSLSRPTEDTSMPSSASASDGFLPRKNLVMSDVANDLYEGSGSGVPTTTTTSKNKLDKA